MEFSARQFARSRCQWLWLALWFSSFLLLDESGFAQAAKPANAREIAAKLDAIKETVAAEVTAALRTNAFKGSYTTVWRQFEDAAIDALERVLPRHVPALAATNFDSGNVGREKNRLADLAIVVGGETVEISIKAARRSANPENDMGTFHDHPNRKQLFADSFTLWVRYEDANGTIKCDRAFFDRTWRFVGKSSLVDGVKYRKKDGNMRPKSWAMFDSGEAFWKTEMEFEAAVKRAETYRANELIKEHLRDLSEEDQRVLYERLREKFAPAAAKP
ncbi:MAG: hypothetical protein EXS35_13845 [Pedosphaera sp.]|nr:hypothetical protein [Pedosphaera sp.]